MPHITSPYSAKGLYKNGHFSTIYSAKLRPTPKLMQERERICLADGDFIDLDWSYSKTVTKKLTLLLHGLEGNAQRTYMLGHAKSLTENGWDVCCVNYRGCSGEDNRSYSSYNAGKTDDLHSVLESIITKDHYTDIALVGFSLGGNLLLKYLGERTSLPKQITKGVAVSAPLSLRGSLARLEEPQNWVYRTSFLLNLKKKFRLKMENHPEQMSAEMLKAITSLKDFDDIYTAPAHGFVDAYDYYAKNSSLQFLPNIQVPVLILNALNDSFLSPECYPFTLSEKRKNIYLETPKHGGHVGFHETHKTYYSESRTVQFLNTNHSL